MHDLDNHAPTLTEMADLEAALTQQGDALTSLEERLGLSSPSPSRPHGLRLVHNAE